MEIKRITLHPLLSDGTIDLNVNLYPKSLLDGIVDREGNPVNVALEEDIPTDVVTHQELQDGLAPKADRSELDSYATKAELAAITTYKTFQQSWVVNRTTNEFCASVDADPSANEGMAYLGEIYLTDMPFNGNGDAVVEIIDGSGTGNKVIHIILTSGNIPPYRWEYTYWSNGMSVSGWIGYQQELASGVNIKTINGNSILGPGDISIPSISDETIEMLWGIDPVLENNSWATIRAVCEAGWAQNYWHVGDTKTVTGGDGYTRSATIVDMTGLYGKHVVFQLRDLSTNAYVFDAEEVNNYPASDIFAKLGLSGDVTLEMTDAALRAQLTQTTVKVAVMQQSGKLVDVTNYLFLPAEKEVTTVQVGSRGNEFAALKTFAFYAGTGDTKGNRILKSPSDATAYIWWLRSPTNTYAAACEVGATGALLDYYLVTNSLRVAPCFSF